MTDALFSAVEVAGPSRAGFRLHHVELFNWGTFDARVWRLSPGGDTALLTGDIGSGKSTLVDAVTTLLLPAQRISYNKAAGADTRERTLRSYVEGHYKSERVEATGSSRPVGLRDRHSYSVILGVFVNEGFDETITIAQVFHQKQASGQPDRFFVTARTGLGIAADFSDFGSDLVALRRRLRTSGAEVHSTFPDYSRTMRRLLAITSEQAMELFHQTVSMKSVGNLNEFVRTHMLEPVDVADRLRGIIAHFEDLTAAHEAVDRARQQLEVLSPLVATADRHDDAVARRSHAEQQRDAVGPLVAVLRSEVLDRLVTQDEAARQARQRERDTAEERRVALDLDRDALRDERARGGGDRVIELERAAADARQQAVQRRDRREALDRAVSDAQLPPVTDAAELIRLPDRVAALAEQIGGRRRELQAKQAGALTARGELRQATAGTRAELESLAGRVSNLPSGHLELRSQLCAELDVAESELPFAGELLDVTDARADWRGAAERVLRGFALSLLVPQQHYDQVTTWVNGRRLTRQQRDGSTVGTRLVYERVSERRLRPTVSRGDGLLLVDCLEVRTGPFEDYLRHELSRRADHVCAETLERFAAETRAVTREGLVRAGERHEKDDRSRVDDPRQWVLGWQNERKTAALTEQLEDQQRRLTEQESALAAVDAAMEALDVRRLALRDLADLPGWDELDHQEAERRAQDADAERVRVLAGSSVLTEIEQRLADTEGRLAEASEQAGQLAGDVRVLEERLRNHRAALVEDQRYLKGLDGASHARADELAPSLRGLLDEVPTSPEECRLAGDRLRKRLQDTVDRLSREMGGYSQSLLQYMAEVRRRWPEATAEMDAAVEARDEYRALHRRVAEDDLPRFEADFKEQLNTNTIRELAQFSTWLNRQAEEIGARVDRINEAMGAIDYSAGSYISLEKERTVNHEVQSFRADLRTATSDAVMPAGEQYSEQRFLDVQRIIERFRGREGRSEADKAWTRRVTDVRNWFTFTASERDRSTEEELEHYRDSDGKSGGQKEKLAYTILAASLAYQFGLQWGVQRTRDFRFAVIDEAFGRGSDVSTRYALELFAKLGLQLLIVTPLQKVRVIEPYVAAIGFVDNPTGRSSRLHTLTIQEYHELRGPPG